MAADRARQQELLNKQTSKDPPSKEDQLAGKAPTKQKSKRERLVDDIMGLSEADRKWVLEEVGRRKMLVSKK